MNICNRFLCTHFYYVFERSHAFKVRISRMIVKVRTHNAKNGNKNGQADDPFPQRVMAEIQKVIEMENTSVAELEKEKEKKTKRTQARDALAQNLVSSSTTSTVPKTRRGNDDDLGNMLIAMEERRLEHSKEMEVQR